MFSSPTSTRTKNPRPKLSHLKCIHFESNSSILHWNSHYSNNPKRNPLCFHKRNPLKVTKYSHPNENRPQKLHINPERNTMNNSSSTISTTGTPGTDKRCLCFPECSCPDPWSSFSGFWNIPK